jgi:CRP-like cAMP-binding protein
MMVMILSGRVALFEPGSDSHPVRRVGSMGPGTSITQLRLLNRSGPPRRLEAERVTTVAMLNSERLQQIEQEHPGIAGQLWVALTERMSGAG